MVSLSTNTLTRVNYGAFALHLLLLLSLVVYRFVKKPKKTSAILLRDTLAPPRGVAECDCYAEEAVESLGATFDIVWAIAAFCAITAGAHLVYATDAFGLYSKFIAGGSNSMRWIEYGITASLMLGIVAVLSGIRNLEKLLLLMAANAVVMLQGFYVEKAIVAEASVFEKLLPLVVGWGLFILIFYVVVFRYQRGINYGSKVAKRCATVATEEGRENEIVESESSSSTLSDVRAAPAAIKYLIWIVVAFFVSFGLVNAVHVFSSFRGTPDFAVYELTYVALSFVSKAFLTIYVMSAVLGGELAWLQGLGSADEPSRCIQANDTR